MGLVLFAGVLSGEGSFVSTSGPGAPRGRERSVPVSGPVSGLELDPHTDRVRGEIALHTRSRLLDGQRSKALPGAERYPQRRERQSSLNGTRHVAILSRFTDG